MLALWWVLRWRELHPASYTAAFFMRSQLIDVSFHLFSAVNICCGIQFCGYSWCTKSVGSISLDPTNLELKMMNKIASGLNMQLSLLFLNKQYCVIEI